jgi:hypothetical protein
MADPGAKEKLIVCHVGFHRGVHARYAHAPERKHSDADIDGYQGGDAAAA